MLLNKQLFFKVFMYADDLLLLVTSLSDLRLMIDICMHELALLDLKVNVRKSFGMRVG